MSGGLEPANGLAGPAKSWKGCTPCTNRMSVMAKPRTTWIQPIGANRIRQNFWTPDSPNRKNPAAQITIKLRPDINDERAPGCQFGNICSRIAASSSRPKYENGNASHKHQQTHVEYRLVPGIIRRVFATTKVPNHHAMLSPNSTIRATPASNAISQGVICIERESTHSNREISRLEHRNAAMLANPSHGSSLI